MDFILEICVESAGSAVNAERAGAGRIELCSALAGGGVTPSQGLIKSVRRNSGLPLHVLIRPRLGDFCYDDAEFEIMKSDIEFCCEAGVEGVVAGILLPDGEVDIERTQMLIGFAGPMSFTFHRAFDTCPDPARSLKEIIKAGAARILTSGQAPSATEGAEMIRDLSEKAAGRIIIMPGGKINESNIAMIAVKTGAKEFHLSAGREISQGAGTDPMLEIINGPGFVAKRTDPDTIRKINEILKLL